ncbi:MAG: hypothetical protein RSE93_02620 [Oscillospiraceae bacterium]
MSTNICISDIYYSNTSTMTVVHLYSPPSIINYFFFLFAIIVTTAHSIAAPTAIQKANPIIILSFLPMNIMYKFLE